MQYVHLTARAQWPHRPFADRENCVDIWAHLLKRFEKVLACVLMPNHIHLVLECRKPDVARLELAIELRAFTRRRFPGKRLWEPLPPPQLLADTEHLKRQIRYVHLNPCRAGLVTDPLDWEWSTHRDAMGAASPIWLDHTAYARLWKWRTREVFHGYVSGDPSVKVEGTPAPQTTVDLPVSLEALIHASAVATRASDRLNPARRALVVGLAERVTRVTRQELAGGLGVSLRAVYKIAQRAPDLAAEAAVLQVLADPRLSRVKVHQKMNSLAFDSHSPTQKFMEP